MAKRAKKKTFKINKKRFISIIAIVVVIILIIFVGPKVGTSIANLIKNKKVTEKGINKDLDNLNGTYVYNDNVKYTFNKKDFTGVLYDSGNEYKFTYTISNQLVTLKFENKNIKTATYTAYFIDGDLKLIGGEGTVGGEYMLKKEK